MKQVLGTTSNIASMTKIRDRPPREETLKAGSFLPVDPFIIASYRHAMKFYSERRGWGRDEIWNALVLDVSRLDARPDELTELQLVIEYVNDNLLDSLINRYGFTEDQIRKGMERITRGPIP
jgi:hypothetical protein